MYKQLREHLSKIEELLESNKDKLPSGDDESGEVEKYMDGDVGESDESGEDEALEMYMEEEMAEPQHKKSMKKMYGKRMFE